MMAAALPMAALAAPPTWLPIGKAAQNSVQRVEELKGIYLECDSASRTHVLDASSAGFCSTAAEELRRTGFDGRFEDMFAWWRSATKGGAAQNKQTATSMASPGKR
jgi:hypothetical protein